ADERFAEVRWSCDIEDSSPTLVGVLAGLETVLLNLLENAGSFSGPNGQVALEVRSEDGTVVIVVRDDGPGIPPADLSRVFDRFFTKRASGKGTGLGLAMVRAIAQAHGGQVSVALPDSGGTELTARLPVEPAD
ncbi:MAG: sensor histidine kinase, partial [Nannocystaceae bacterium]|nr:sensor histidine kinase [Nannocystaceae bacterium]